MARKDRTFHGGDLIRLLGRNLIRHEQDDVILFLYMVIPEVALARIEERILGPSVPVPGLARSFISVALRAIALLRLLPNAFRRRIIMSLMSAEARKEVPKAIDRLGIATVRPPFRMGR